MIRNRDLFKLWRVDYRNNVAEPQTALVWAHRMSDALNIVEEYASKQPNRHVMEVHGIAELYTPDTDTEDYAAIAWTGGTEPAWESR